MFNANHHLFQSLFIFTTPYTNVFNYSFHELLVVHQMINICICCAVCVHIFLFIVIRIGRLFGLLVLFLK